MAGMDLTRSWFAFKLGLSISEEYLEVFACGELHWIDAQLQIQATESIAIWDLHSLHANEIRGLRMFQLPIWKALYCGPFLFRRIIAITQTFPDKCVDFQITTPVCYDLENVFVRKFIVRRSSFSTQHEILLSYWTYACPSWIRSGKKRLQYVGLN
jgi:hypothetical protein